MNLQDSRTTKAVWHLAVVCTLGLLAPVLAAQPAGTDVQVKDAWVRWLPADTPGAGYMTLVNTGSTEHVLVAVDSPDYADVGMHLTQDDHGIARMTPVTSIDLKPHDTVRFAEGGYHLMLMRPHRAIHPGDKVLIKFHFDSGPVVSVPFEVRAGS